jgi:general secretion pathway protein M
MMTAIRQIWAARSRREQAMLGVLFALLTIMIAWFGIINPLRSGLETAQLRLDRASLASGQINARVAALKSLARAAPASTISISDSVGTTATDAGFTLARREPQGRDGVAITLTAARTAVVFAWLDTLARKGIVAEHITIRANSDATVAVDATLRTRPR